MTTTITYHKLAVLITGNGIELDTYGSVEEMLKAWMYRYCAQTSTPDILKAASALRDMANEVAAQIVSEYAEPPTLAAEIE